MLRRHFLHNTALLTAGSVLIQSNALAAWLGAKPGTVRMLRRNVGIFTERGGTIGFLLNKEGIVVIDAQFPEQAGHCIEELKKTSAAPFQYLLNTHHHGDHTGGNVAFKGLVQGVVSHENALKNLKAVSEKARNVDKQYYPTLTFTDEYKLKLGDEKLKGYYFGAGHTNGDAVYHFETADVFHVGDLMFNKRHPYVDRSTGANMRNWITVLEKIQKKGSKDSIYIFGHSLTPGEETGTREDLKRFADYLDKVLRFAEAEVKRGVSKEEFIKNTTIPGNTLWSGDGIQRPLTAAWEEVSGG